MELTYVSDYTIPNFIKNIFLYQIFHFDITKYFTFKSIVSWSLLYGDGFEDSTPNLDSVNGVAFERLAIGLIIYTICYIIQLLLCAGIYEPYIKNVCQQFVDICSMSNISVFIYSLDSYGYYIHGR